MKLFKFRSLGNCVDFERVEQIIEEEKFWCSKLWDLNDPMEGVYRNSDFKTRESKDVFTEKNKYFICSFSGKKGFDNPILWGYYANGFKGLAIEIEVKKSDVKKIVYVTQEEFKKNLDDAIKIITRKLNDWEHEDEWRFLKYEDDYRYSKLMNEMRIENIVKIYFGKPYGDLVNTTDIISNSNSLKKYYSYKDKLEKICKNKGIDFTDYSIKLDENKNE